MALSDFLESLPSGYWLSVCRKCCFMFLKHWTSSGWFRIKFAIVQPQQGIRESKHKQQTHTEGHTHTQNIQTLTHILKHTQTHKQTHRKELLTLRCRFLKSWINIDRNMILSRILEEEITE